jgi:shikimate dehydrogenase
MSSINLAEQRHFPFDGGCELLFMAGSPVAQVQTPAILNQRFLREGQRRLVVPLHLSLEGLPLFVESMRQLKNAAGLLVTMPHKSLLCEMSDAPSARAALLGFSNVLRITDEGFLESDCLDGDALMAAIKSKAVDFVGKTALLVGCGGAGAAYGEALVRSGVGHIGLIDTDKKRAEDLARKLNECGTGAEVSLSTLSHHLKAELLINASPIGMYSEQECAFSEAAISQAELVVDATTPSWKTRLIRIAEVLAIPNVDGKALALAQVNGIVRFFWQGGSDFES